MITQNNTDTLPENYLQQVFDGSNYHFLETKSEVDLFASFVAPKIENGVISEDATPDQIFKSDPRNHADYYLVRAEAGQKLVNDITNILLFEYKSGVRSLSDTMAIEAKLDGVIASLNFGQLITAEYKISQVTGIDTELHNQIKASIHDLTTIHYA